jgi:hypothetical protein
MAARSSLCLSAFRLFVCREADGSLCVGCSSVGEVAEIWSDRALATPSSSFSPLSQAVKSQVSPGWSSPSLVKAAPSGSSIPATEEVGSLSAIAHPKQLIGGTQMLFYG